MEDFPDQENTLYIPPFKQSITVHLCFVCRLYIDHIPEQPGVKVDDVILQRLSDWWLLSCLCVRTCDPWHWQLQSLGLRRQPCTSRWRVSHRHKMNRHCQSDRLVMFTLPPPPPLIIPENQILLSDCASSLAVQVSFSSTWMFCPDWMNWQLSHWLWCPASRLCRPTSGCAAYQCGWLAGQMLSTCRPLVSRHACLVVILCCCRANV